MKKEVLSQIKRKHIWTVFYTVLGGMLILLSGITIICVYGLLSGRLASIKYLYFFGCSFAVTMLILIVFRCQFKQEAKEKRVVNPYIIQIKGYETAEIKKEFIHRLSMDELQSGELFSYVKGKRNILFLLYQMSYYNKKQYSTEREKTTRKVRHFVGLNNQLPISEVKNICRVNILLLNSVSEDVLNQIAVNAVYGMRYAEAVLNVYVDIQTLSLYIPAYISLWNGGSSKYCFCVKTLLDLLTLE